MISIIIPIYNSATFLDACLDSVLKQTYSDFEVVCIDDGSTDSSLLICDNYASKDKRVRVFHKNNGGVSSARNFGISVSKGELLCFVDSDDVINSHYLESLHNALHINTDISICGWSRTSDIKADDPKPSETIQRKEFVSNIFKPKQWPLIVCMLMRREIIISNSILFDENIFWGEDSEFFLHYLSCCAGDVGITTYIGYVYRNHTKSAMNNLSFRSLTAVDAAYKSEKWLSQVDGVNATSFYHIQGTIAKLLYLSMTSNNIEIFNEIHSRYDVRGAMQDLLKSNDFKKKLFSLTYLSLGPSLLFKVSNCFK